MVAAVWNLALALAGIAAGGVDQLRDRPILILLVFEYCLAGACFTLWRAAPDFKVFRGMGAYFVLTGLDHTLQYFTGHGSQAMIGAGTSLILVEAAADAMQEKRRGWTRLLWPFYALQLLAGILPSLAFAQSVGVDVSEAALAWMSWRGLRRGGRTRLVAGAFALFTLTRLTISADFRALTSIPMYVEIGGWRTYTTSPVNVLLGIMTLVVCFRDLLQDRREKQRLASELEAGRAVQQLLLSAPTTAGKDWKMEAVYLPAAEVGGDFYTLLESGDKQFTLIIGDVSGKGLRAAMVVATILGAVRREGQEGATISPAELLRRLNRTLCTSGLGGFASCVCASIDSGRIVRIANAGHPSPYLNGREIECPGALPLGIAPNADYEEVAVDIEPGDHLMFVTDGVIEAQDAAGKLFGFEKTQEMSLAPAGTVAEAARAFGQTDDITVISMVRTTGMGNVANPAAGVVEAPQGAASV